VFVYVCAFFCVCVQVEALRRTYHPSKESYRLSLIKKLRKLSPMLQKREQGPKCESIEEEKNELVEVNLFQSIVSSPCTYTDRRFPVQAETALRLQSAIHVRVFLWK
jgi:hypothetical protein